MQNSTKTNNQEANTSQPDYTREVSQVIDKERSYLNIPVGQTGRGLAISGGGIRSASFGLGVMQALVAKNQLEKMDYLSTVSGGGYLGSALTWALHKGGSSAGTSPSNFPLGSKSQAARQDTSTSKQKSVSGESEEKTGNKLLNYIRQHASYLTPTAKLDIVSFVGIVVRSVVISLAVYFCIMVVIFTLFQRVGLFGITHFSNYIESLCPLLPNRGLFLGIASVLSGIYLLGIFLYSLSTYRTLESGKTKAYLWFINVQINIGLIWKAAFACVLLGALPYIDFYGPGVIAKIITASGLTFSGVLTGVWQYIKAQRNEKNSGGIPDAFIYLGAFSLLYGLMLLAYMTTGLFFNADRSSLDSGKAFLLFTLITVIFSLVVNLNTVGPHRIWRYRLMETFMPGKSAIIQNQWQPAKDADAAEMSEMCNETNPKPYHLVNTNLILANAKQVTYRGRGGDNFIISKFYSGSEATGWKNTKTFQKKNNKSRGITLATAMATSAAALNPNAGVSGSGATRNAVVSVLLSTLNLRLGYWTINPDREKGMIKPNFIVPGITAEIMGMGFNESEKEIMLSDGGHFENLAIYELIRRRLKVIVLSDGGADGGFNFDDLGNAIEKARVDFGAKIVFREDYDLGNILPGTAGKEDFEQKYGVAKKGFAVADIYYKDMKNPEQEQGVLYYVKLTMIENLPTDVYSYKGVNPTFPHESTADQFFDEKQFEAYRELGYCIGTQLLEEMDANGKLLYS